MFSVRVSLLGPSSPPLPPHQEVAASFLSPLQGTLRNLSHFLLRDGAGVCVWNTDVFSNSTLDCSGVGLYNFKECLDFPRIVWIAP